MPQGKIKVKTTMPSNVKGKKVKKLDKQPPKRKVQRKFNQWLMNRRSYVFFIAQCKLIISSYFADNPIGPKKVQIMEEKQMRKNISKTINKTLEDRLVSQVASDGRPLTLIGKNARKAEQEDKKGKKANY